MEGFGKGGNWTFLKVEVKICNFQTCAAKYETSEISFTKTAQNNGVRLQQKSVLKHGMHAKYQDGVKMFYAQNELLNTILSTALIHLAFIVVYFLFDELEFSFLMEFSSGSQIGFESCLILHRNGHDKNEKVLKSKAQYVSVRRVN